MSRVLEHYSDRLGSAPANLRRLVEKDLRIVAFSIEPDGCFIYTNSDQWCDGHGSGTFRGDTVTQAIRKFKKTVQEAET